MSACKGKIRVTKMKNYKNFTVTGREKIGDRQASWQEWDSITEAKKYAEKYCNVVVFRAYYAKDTGDLLHIRAWN